MFSDATLSMSVSSRPTIPFVLALYHKMDNHLTDTIESTVLPYSIRCGATQARVKLRKYSSIAEKNQYYTLGTGTYP